jgi:hypothetical protein
LFGETGKAAGMAQSEWRYRNDAREAWPFPSCGAGTGFSRWSFLTVSSARWQEESSVLTNLEQSRERTLRIRIVFYLLRVFVRRRSMK